MTYCYRCPTCLEVVEKPAQGDYVCGFCSSVLLRDYRAEASYVSVTARPTSRKKHHGRHVSTT